MGSPVRRTLSAAVLNAAANDPEVRPWLGMIEAGALDLTPLVADPANVTLANEHGGFLVHCVSGGVYEVHSIFTAKGRGRLVAETQRGLHFMFTATDAVRVVTKVPACNPRAAVLSAKAGFETYAERPDDWDAPDGTRCAVSYQVVSLDRWIATAPGLPEAGQALADLVGYAGTLDAVALRTLGAVAEMLRCGNPEKAAHLYGTRAASMTLPPLAVLALRPPILVMNERTVQACAGCLEVI